MTMFKRNRETELPNLNKESVIERLKMIKYPGFSRDIVSFGIVKNLVIRDSSVFVTLNITSQNQQVREQIVTLVREQLESLPGVKKVELQTEVPEAPPSHAPSERAAEKLLSNVKYKIAVASGKGGVGKSTVAVNLALALADRGARVGLFDADIYGPNIPIMLGTREQPRGKEGKVLPLERYGIKLMSIGFFLEGNAPVIWRGPLVGKAIEQLMRDVAWEGIDFFLVDMPPGTGDAQLSLSSLIDLSGAIMVSTPQDVALADVIKGVKMFQKVNVTILGLVENMSYFVCPHCGERSEIFDHGNTQKACAELDVPYLGEIPFHTSIRIGSDQGKPIVVTEPESVQAQAFFEIAEKVIEKMPI